MDETATARSRTPTAHGFGADPYAPSTGGPEPDDEAGLDDRSLGTPGELARQREAFADALRLPVRRAYTEDARRAAAAVARIADTFRRLGLAADGRAPFDIPDLFRELSGHAESLAKLIDARIPPDDGETRP